MKEIKGKILKLGDNVDTAQILSEQYRDMTDTTELASHVLETYNSNFPSKLQQTKVLVAGSSFGLGTSPSVAVKALKAAGLTCIIAKSFARAFFHEAVNHGLPVVTADLVNTVGDNDDIVINLEQGKITHAGAESTFAPYPEFVRAIVQAGDLIAAVKKKLGKR